MSAAQILDFAPIPEHSVPPQNIEAESEVLGGIMIDPDAIARVIGILKASDFYISSHQQIYQGMLALYEASMPTDLRSVSNWLIDHKLIDRAGGKNKLIQLVDCTVSAINIDFTAQVVADKAASRRLISVGHEIVKLGYDQTQNLMTRLDIAEQLVFAQRQQKTASREPEALSDILPEYFTEIENLYNGGETPAVTSGFYDLDRLLAGGFYPGDLIVVGGRPSMGKTAFSCAIAYKIADDYRVPTLIFSLEMPKKSIVNRYISNIASIEGDRLKQGHILPAELPRFCEAVAVAKEIPVIIDETPCPTIQEIRSKVRSVILRYGSLKLVVIDYLQLLVADSSDNRLVQQIGQITKQLKHLARECNVPIMLLSQLNRGLEGAASKRPSMNHLRESGRIEEDADVILFPYRDEYYNPDTPDRGVMEINCVKHRNGATGTVHLLFDGAFSRLRNLTTRRM